MEMISFLFLLLLSFLSLEALVAALNDCVVEQHPNGFKYTLGEHVVLSEIFNWLVNEIVKANEVSMDPIMVYSRGPRFVVLKSCEKNVSYRSPLSSVPQDCLALCPTTPAPEEVSSADASNPHAAIVGWSVAGAVVLCALVVLLVLWLKKDQVKRCCCPETPAVETCAYKAAELGDSAPS